MKKILVIDDEEWLREMIRMALRQKGYEVLEASDGAGGIEIARRELPDLILCDVNMERVDGYLTLSSLRNEPATSSIPFILMTGMADSAGMRHGMELGADDYLPKPFTLEGLHAAVEARLKKAQAVRQEAEKKLADLRDNLSMMLPHELRTPLNGILAYAEILMTDAATLPTKEIAEMGQVIHDSGKRLERLVENFLIYARVELLNSDSQQISTLRQHQSLHPSRLIEEHARRQAAGAKRPADIVFELADIPLPISEEYLGKIVDELTQNALKFSQPGTPVKIALAESGDAVTLSISDRGRGFETEHIRKVGAYMQFNRKLNEQQGAGLGLVIAKRLAELHGAAFGIQKSPAGGTVVSVRFPKTVAKPLARSA